MTVYLMKNRHSPCEIKVVSTHHAHIIIIKRFFQALKIVSAPIAIKPIPAIMARDLSLI